MIAPCLIICLHNTRQEQCNLGEGCVLLNEHRKCLKCSHRFPTYRLNSPLEVSNSAKRSFGVGTDSKIFCVLDSGIIFFSETNFVHRLVMDNRGGGGSRSTNVLN